jgi:hypothetical protein
MNKAILLIPVIAILLGITLSPLTTAYSDTGFNNGYAKGKFDITHGRPLNDTCLPKGLACDQFQSGYITAVNQKYCSSRGQITIPNKLNHVEFINYRLHLQCCITCEPTI